MVHNSRLKLHLKLDNTPIEAKLYIPASFRGLETNTVIWADF